MKRLNIDLVYNHADFRLLSKRALAELARYKETTLFLRVLSALGYPSTVVYYDRKTAGRQNQIPIEENGGVRGGRNHFI